MDQEKIRNEIALFKFSLIAPVINGGVVSSDSGVYCQRLPPEASYHFDYYR